LCNFDNVLTETKCTIFGDTVYIWYTVKETERERERDR